MRRYVLSGLVLCLALGARPVHAQSLSFQLWRLGDPSDPDPGHARYAYAPNADNPSQTHQVLVPYDPRAQERFARFATDLALAITPLPAGLSSSAGDAGLDVAFSMDFAQIHPIQRFSDGSVQYVWPTATAPGSTLYLPTLHLRKGLPLSFQVGVDLSYIVNSALFVPTVWAQWSLIEGHRWIPDVHIRGLGTVLLGAGDLTEVVAGWDVGTSYRIPIYGHVVAAVYGGYQQLGLSASTQNINFDPRHDGSSQTPTGMSSQLSSSDVFSPLSYGNPITPTTRIWRVYFGAQVKWNILLVGVDCAYGAADNHIGDGFDTSYSLSSWKTDVRVGLLF